jgi:membrane protein DedA with SNARE-associated domain
MHREKTQLGLWSKKELIFGILGVLITITLGVLAIYYNKQLTNLANMSAYSLAGMFLIAFIASSTLSITPIAMPYWLVTIWLPHILAPQYGIWAAVWVALVTAAAASLGQFMTFLIGYGGSSTLSKKLSQRFSPEVYERASNWIKRIGSKAVFVMSFIPNPIHLPMTILIALLKYPPYKFIFYSFSGLLLRSAILAFSGYYFSDILLQWVAKYQTEGFMHSPVFVIVMVIVGIILAIGIWQLIIWMLEMRDKNRKYKAAVECAKKNGKPLLVIGGPWGVKAFRKMFNKPAHGNGDVCLDIDRRALGSHPCGIVASCTDIPFGDNAFGAVFSSHVLEHMPTTQIAEKALGEMKRVAGSMFIAYPSRQSFAAWIIRDHHIWVWQKGGKTILKQRKDRAHGEHQSVKTAGQNV